MPLNIAVYEFFPIHYRMRSTFSVVVFLRVWTNRGKEVRRHCYRCVVFMPSYHERERKTVSGVAKNAVKDLLKAVKVSEVRLALWQQDGCNSDTNST